MSRYLLIVLLAFLCTQSIANTRVIKINDLPHSPVTALPWESKNKDDVIKVVFDSIHMTGCIVFTVVTEKMDGSRPLNGIYIPNYSISIKAGNGFSETWGYKGPDQNLSWYSDGSIGAKGILSINYEPRC